MRLPVVGDISTKDGSSDKNPRMFNALAEIKKSGKGFATVRPGLSEVTLSSGDGYGLVCFDGTLTSIYGSTLRTGVYSTVFTDTDLNPDIAGYNNSTAYAASSNGDIVVGTSNYSYDRGFIFYPSIDVQTEIAGTKVFYGVSGSGNVACGLDLSNRAIKWSSTSGVELIGPASTNSSVAYGVSSDGNVITGWTNEWGNQKAFKWTSDDGMVDLGTLGGTYSAGKGCSSDGTVIAGESTLSGGQYRAFKWTEAGGMVNLGTLGGTSSTAYCISEDGGTICGASYNAGNTINGPFRWTEADGMIYLGLLPSTIHGTALGVSSDGSVIVGNCVTAGYSPRAFMWTAATGMVSLLGAVWGYAYGVSSDGLTIVGTQEYGGSYQHAFSGYYEEVLTLVNIGTVDSSIGNLFDFAQIP